MIPSNVSNNPYYELSIMFLDIRNKPYYELYFLMFLYIFSTNLIINIVAGQSHNMKKSYANCFRISGLAQQVWTQ